MKKLILSISAFALVASYSAQITFNDINPDAMVHANFVVETYSIDFDGGGAIDLDVFGMKKDTTLSSVPVRITGIALDIPSTTEVVGTFATMGTEQVLVADTLLPATPIDASSTYASTTVTPLFDWVGLAMESVMQTSNTPLYSAGVFAGAGMKYLGVKFMIGSDTHYGWVRVSVTANSETCVIESYAYETIANTAINAGETGNGTVTVVENPFKNVIISTTNKEINILGLNGADVKIYSLIGNQVYNNRVASDVVVNLSNQASGVYLVNYSQDGFTVSKKVIIK